MRKVELPLAKGRRRDSKKAFFNAKEGRDDFRKTDIRQRFPEPYASMYCQQFDNFKNIADFLEFAAKLMRR